jgi:hypothetical protein
MRERRQQPRQRVLKGAVIFFNKGRSSVDCTVRNLTKIGARVVLESTNLVPDQFEVLVKQEKRLYSAETIWRDSTDIGVRFTAPPRPIRQQKRGH